MYRIMFVCHGNICRSPMAEFVMKKMVKDIAMENLFIIKSSATSTEEIGNPVHPGTRDKLAKHGISTRGKVSVQLCKADYSKYDYFIGMDSRNISQMLHIFGGDSECKVYKLLSFCGRANDIADPWYTGNFDITYNDILEGCKALLVGLVTI